MSYRKEKVLVYWPKEWYDKVEKIYSQYHKKLDEWDKWLFKRFLPRSMSGMNVVDLGAGDWRMVKFFENKWIKRYVACDISEKMLNRWKNWYEKKVMDLDEKMDFNDWEFDLALAFFSILYIKNLQSFFDEVYRILSPWSRFVVLHHVERRPVEYKIWGEEFKIMNIPHRYEFVEEVANNSFFTIDFEPIYENWILVWKLYCFTKD